MATPAGSSGTSNIPKMDIFLTKKTITQGLLDIALLTANVAQLKYVMSLGSSGSNAHPYYYTMLVLLWSSIFFQTTTGMCLILLGKTTITEETAKRADVLNNFVTGQVFLIAVINILISGFNIEESIERSNRISDWVADAHNNNSAYFAKCPCIDPIRSFYTAKEHCG